MKDLMIGGIVLLVVLNLALIISADLNETFVNNTENDIGNTSCSNLYWYDDENRECSQKEFCGAYMYFGLKVFQNETECMQNLEVKETKANSTKFKKANGKEVNIKVLPETASERAQEVLGLKCEERNCTLVLKEVPASKDKVIIENLSEESANNKTEGMNSSNGDIVYEFEAEKEGKIFGLFKAKGKVQALVNAQTGEIEKTKKPWWAFLATGI